MFPPVFSLAQGSTPVKAIFGTNPIRIYPFGEAPQGVMVTYAVWQSIGILPENYLRDNPDSDQMSCQIDVYGAGAKVVREGAQALRDLYQAHGYVTAMREWAKDEQTNLYRYQLDVDFWVYR